ncbi:MAG: PEP-CTERM sorting domain-containing protein [Phycisphaerae bacterium]
MAALAFPDSIAGDDILLATITLSADALGETDLLLSTTAGDLTEGFPLDPTGFAGITFEPGHVTVIPAPGTVLLGMIGLGVAGWAKRRHR